MGQITKTTKTLTGSFSCCKRACQRRSIVVQDGEDYLLKNVVNHFIHLFGRHSPGILDSLNNIRVKSLEVKGPHILKTEKYQFKAQMRTNDRTTSAGTALSLRLDPLSKLSKGDFSMVRLRVGLYWEMYDEERRRRGSEEYGAFGKPVLYLFPHLHTSRPPVTERMQQRVHCRGGFGQFLTKVWSTSQILTKLWSISAV